jgi:hypothetical protein
VIPDLPRFYRAVGLRAKSFGGGTKRLQSGGQVGSMPDTLRFLLIIACLAGAIYGGAWALANFPPEQTEIVRALPHDKLRQKL